ncbi:2-amino-4-hydroxy-6-hydroxymethyldihydropteridine diphosphokinase [bacterium]|nr:2-amino-4-hydroxy-6-hydroxymethyldihydropteridine diphosphokinase [bacterium]
MSILPPIHNAFLGLGANLGDRLDSLQGALVTISNWPRCTVVWESAVLETPPWGPVKEQPYYLNQVIQIRTAQPVLALLDLIRETEWQAGRRDKEEEEKGARTLDIDILLFDDLVHCMPHLTLPHPSLDRPYLAPFLEEVKARVDEGVKF